MSTAEGAGTKQPNGTDVNGKTLAPQHFADSQGLTELCITPGNKQSPSDSDMTPDVP